MTERENRQAQAEAVQRTAKSPSTPQRTRVDDALRRYLTAEARRTRRNADKDARDPKSRKR
jgi:hypothetical protein